jgi:peptidyl-tRNA hydrolase, PTH1 family
VVIAGLGNPGSRYELTPHNVGFLVVDELGRRHQIPISKREGKSLVGTGRIGDTSVILVKPQTFMNLSGEGVGPVLSFRKLGPSHLTVVHDELDLPWGALRIKEKGSAAGHNGVKSIIAALDTDVFTRVRVGIRPDEVIRSVSDYVLAPVGPDRAIDLRDLVSYTADAVEAIVAEGAVKAMTKFNRRAGGINEDE